MGLLEGTTLFRLHRGAALLDFRSCGAVLTENEASKRG